MVFIKVSIEYCNKCKWQQRAVWYMQELLQTFDGKINEISLVPNNETPGTFKVTLLHNDKEKILYKKKMKKSSVAQNEPYIYEGFPDSKFLKVLLRNEISPEENLGHVDKYTNYQLTDPNSNSNDKEVQKTEIEYQQECQDCKIQQ